MVYFDMKQYFILICRLLSEIKDNNGDNIKHYTVKYERYHPKNLKHRFFFFFFVSKNNPAVL